MMKATGKKKCINCKNCNCKNHKPKMRTITLDDLHKSPQFYKEVLNSLKWIDEVAEIRDYINFNRTTYKLKHLAENYISHDTYISADSFVTACFIKGLMIEQVSENNYCVNLFDKGDPKRLPKFYYKDRDEPIRPARYYNPISEIDIDEIKQRINNVNL